MGVRSYNDLLSQDNSDLESAFEKIKESKKEPFQFKIDFGLGALPEEPGLLIIRGARQYGKSTWLEMTLNQSYQKFGKGTSFYINAEELKDPIALYQAVEHLCQSFLPTSKIKRIFIDEISSIEGWSKALKLLHDKGITKEVLLITTGSDASDLRRGDELLPGRKGKLSRTNYLFTPISFNAFAQHAENHLTKEELVPAYLLSGGSPIASKYLIIEKSIPDFVVMIIKDWIYGAIAKTGRQRSTLLALFELLFKYAGNAVSEAKLAREAGVANNTVINGYIEQLQDLLCVAQAHHWDPSKKRGVPRRPRKFHMINLLAAVAWSPLKMTSLENFHAASEQEKAKWYEWLVAQELWRRRAIQGVELPEIMTYWKGDNNEIDFIESKDTFLEVKSGLASPLEFNWFPKVFPSHKLQIVNQASFATQFSKGVMFEEFLLS